MFSIIHLLQDQSKISRYISNTLLSEIENTLKKGEKVLLYLNRRGAYSSLICQDCQKLWECPNCDTSFTVHQNPQKLICHLCSSTSEIPHHCDVCHGTNLISVGVGTQQIEAALKKHFSSSSYAGKGDVSIYRFDGDSMKNVASKRLALTELQDAHIIIGTKMITTGFNFDKVGLIGILLVEQELSYPSYDAEEKAYSNLKQVIGRGNRKNQQTQILMQTYIPKNPILQRITQTNFKEFFNETLTERKKFLYPPYTEMATLEYRNKDILKSGEFSKKLEKKLEEYNTKHHYQILRGTTAFKKNNSYHSVLIIKGKNIRALLQHIEKIILRESGLSVIFH